MANRIALGNDMYLIRKNATMSNELLISSHGVYRGFLDGGKIKVPAWTQLFFFTAHGKALLDPGIEPLIGGKIVPFEIRTRGDEIPNYRLSKYQGSHNKTGETYESIENVLSKPKWAIDVLTIRNRWWGLGTGVTLNHVLSALAAAHYQYQFIYCSFCRSNLL